MIRALHASCLAALLTSTAIVAATAQEVGEFSDVQIVGHVLEPVKLEPTDARVAGLELPPGFTITKFAEDLVNPRMLQVSAAGNVYVTRRSVGDVVMLADTDGDGRADLTRTVASRPLMHGIAIDGTQMYLATDRSVFRADIRNDGSLSELERIIDDLPDGGQHPNRTLAVGPDRMLYISAGSTCNACAEPNPENATILRATLDGAQRTIFASGLRNTIGFGWHPESGELWGMDHGIDWLGNDEQGEELNRIVEGKKYGWPYVFGDRKLNPQDNPPAGISLEDWAASSEVPALLYTAHSAPMQMVFYDGEVFPEAYRGDAFIAMRGSWNRNPPSGYEVVRIDFEDGRPVAFEPFVTGFMKQQDDGSWGQFARLAGLAVAPDGALYLADDSGGVIYRITYDGDGESAAAAASPPSGGAGETVGTGETIAGKQPTPDQLARDILGGDQSLEIASAAFAASEEIPLRYSGYGENISPPLSWSEPPEGTRSFAIIEEDPDASSEKPFVHWIIANIPADVRELREGIPGQPRLELPASAIQGTNSAGSIGYVGSKPPIGDPAHHYHFQVFALDTTLDLPVGAHRKDFLDAMAGHVLAQGNLTGTFAATVDAAGDPMPDAAQEHGEQP